MNKVKAEIMKRLRARESIGHTKDSIRRIEAQYYNEGSIERNRSIHTLLQLKERIKELKRIVEELDSTERGDSGFGSTGK